MTNIILTIKKHIVNILNFDAVKTALAFIVGYFVSIFDITTRDAILALIILSVLDFVMKMYVIWKTDDIYRSEKLSEKAYKLIAHLFLIWIGALINHSVQVPTGYSIDDLLIGWFGLSEDLSLLEKAKRLGVNIPDVIFRKIQDKKDTIQKDTEEIIKSNLG